MKNLPFKQFQNAQEKIRISSIIIISLFIFFGFLLTSNDPHSHEKASIVSIPKESPLNFFAPTKHLKQIKITKDVLRIIGSGTGFYINQQGILATARHVIVNCSKIGILGPGGVLRATVVGTNSDKDLAILRTAKTPNTYAPLQINPVIKVGHSVFLVGYPLIGRKEEKIITGGFIRSPRFYLSDTYELQTVSPVQPGNSGGPVLNWKGAVIGIIAARSSMLQNIAIMTKLENLIELVRKQNIVLTTRLPNTNLTTEEGVRRYVYRVLCFSSQAGASG